jgi:NAD(P)-dependent dehydrogenase (short-subunit alcohol dehydrogenase family)
LLTAGDGIVSSIGDSETLQVLVATTQAKVGKPDILVGNAAGKAPIGSLEKVEATVFDEAMISNVWNNLLLANLVAPDMVARRTMAVEWGPYQVRTNAIAPTAVRTDFSRVLWETPDALARATARVLAR